MGRPVLARAVEGEEDPDVVVQQQVKVGVEDVGVAGVADDDVAVAVLMIEAERHAGERRGVLGLGRVHLPRGGVLRMRPQPYLPLSSWASMKRVMSSPVAARLPAGAGPTNS